MSNWWSEPDAVRRVVRDLIAAELAQSRRGEIEPGIVSWTDDTSLGEDGIGADSIERMTLAAALSEGLHLHEAGLEDHLLATRTLGEWCAVVRTCLEVCHHRLTFRTSGSTGAPKGCTHSVEALAQEAAFHAGLFVGRRRILAAVPSHHIYGFLFTVLLPRQLGVSVVDVRWRSPGALLAVMRPDDLVVGFPLFWSSLLRGIGELQAAAWGVTSTAPCPVPLAGAMECALGRFVEVYGASETGGVGWRDSHRGPYRLFPFWRRSGEGPSLRRVSEEAAEREVVPQDMLAWHGLDTFTVIGRRDGAVQVAGMNVFPKHIEQVLSTHGDVDQCCVRPMTAPEGERLKAFIVPREGTDRRRLRRELPAWLDRRLSPPERPRMLRFGDVLPRDELGKPADWSDEEEAESDQPS